MPLNLNEKWRRSSSVWGEISQMPLRFGGKGEWIPFSLKGIDRLSFLIVSGKKIGSLLFSWKR